MGVNYNRPKKVIEEGLVDLQWGMQYRNIYGYFISMLRGQHAIIQSVFQEDILEDSEVEEIVYRWNRKRGEEQEKLEW